MPIGGELQRKHRRSSQSLSFGRVTRSVTPLDEAHTIKLTSPLFFLSFCAYSQPPRHTFLLLPIGSLVPISCRSIRQCAVVYVPLPSSILIDLPLTRQTRPPVCPLCSQYFDEHGKGIKPFCNQGSRCRFIHPSDLQWDKGRVNPEKSAYNDTKCEKSKTKPKHKPKASSTSPLQRGPRSSPLVPQSDLFRRNHGELDRERGRDREVKPIQRDRRDRDFDSWERYVRERDRSRDVRRSSRERADEERALHSSKRSKRTEGVSIPYRLYGRQDLI
ncbi:hypothetical protein EV424DRAFT_128570 [Suillus variegatus]|nr:hypothetical protein EV424DRAFT_128570 [Suillus variegatus]